MPKTNKQEPQNLPKQPKQRQNSSNSTFDDKKHQLTTSPNTIDIFTAPTPITNPRNNINSPSSPKLNNSKPGVVDNEHGKYIKLITFILFFQR